MDEISLLKKRTSIEALQNMIRNDDSNQTPPKIKRSFSLKRDLIRSKHIRQGDMDDTKLRLSMFRKPSSWNKVLGKMLQKMSYIGLQQDKGNLCSKYDAYISRSSSDIYNENTFQGPKILTGDKVPGVVGLRNQGNTCFMNAVLQCLSHTDVLARYFVMDQYKMDLTRRNKLNSKKYGTRGEMTEQLALLLKSIWLCKYDPDMSNQFKAIVDKYGSQYRGNNQHDAQEFLLWLLDKVHEDLNTATKKKYKTIRNTFGRPDEQVAAETLANHVRCNESFIHNVFQAQFKSSLTCPRCMRQSNTFDPFLCISIPVPQCYSTPVYVTVIYTSQQPREVKLGLSLQIDFTIAEFRELLWSYTGIQQEHMLITEITDIGFNRTFCDSMPVSMIKESDPLYCLELPKLNECSNESGPYLLLCWVNVLVIEDQCSRFGSAFTMQICRETSYKDLQKLLLKEMASMLHDDILTAEQDIPLFGIRLADASDLPQYLDPTVELPLFTDPIDQALAMSGDQPHIKFILEWDLHAKKTTIADHCEQVEEHASVKQLKLNSEHGTSITLEQCFDMYTKEEILGPENAWHCPQCNLKQEVVKKLGLWTLPDILVVHLKRFRQSLTLPSTRQQNNKQPTKLSVLVDFPLYSFDMTPHLAIGRDVRVPLKPPSSRRLNSIHDRNLYDLYAVCNHHGSDPHSGHYTAFCKNPYDKQWYSFDDTKVTPIPDTSLVTTSAYMLFYQRRDMILNGTDHWATRLHTRISNSHSVGQIVDNKENNSENIDELSDSPSSNTISRSSTVENDAVFSRSNSPTVNDRIQTEPINDESDNNFKNFLNNAKESCI
ncbi:ubiquitin carboxyl-terminal hydrolase 43 [Daktulosphaira vitifoliae]|uniref:ubiquitin carboxyl-terminal hydrolase 43 n=1 Tax=Daktulosphaira vitifoliae TaxID=58002 RepID=UPI0021AA0161|nr:ubiquitin carboxyl-terminal hydrolase 43 [Daktulosphaira vitifoliae]